MDWAQAGGQQSGRQSVARAEDLWSRTRELAFPGESRSLGEKVGAATQGEAFGAGLGGKVLTAHEAAVAKQLARALQQECAQLVHRPRAAREAGVA